MSETPTPRRPGPPHHPEVRRVVRRQREMSQNPTPEEQTIGFRGWNERGYVPHRDEPRLTQFVTFRLADSIPAELRAEWEILLKIDDDRRRRAQLEAWLDLGHGECHLRDERIAWLVQEALRKFEGTRYRMIAFTIMPNHVHVLFEVGEVPMANLVRDWKGATARAANALLGLKGAFWQADYWDTYIRDAEHEEQTIRYIQNNPVKAGLVKKWQQWPWTFVRSAD